MPKEITSNNRQNKIWQCQIEINNKKIKIIYSWKNVDPTSEANLTPSVSMF